MRLLKITLIAVGLLVLLKIAEIVLARVSPFTILFHQNLLKSLQLLVLGWLILSLILSLLLKNKLYPVQRISILSILFLALVFELIFGYWLQHPAGIPSILLPAFKEYYVNDYRHIIQVERNCSEYDERFFYRLRPNVQCNFSNIEFSTPIQTNSLGCRDDEASISQPDVICLGDSYAMGWGVQQQEAFPQRLQRMSGLKVLNAAMSSFGTVRELRKLQTLDTSNCKWIILQYCDNDVEETKPFVDNLFSLKTSSSATYDSLVKKYEWGHVYYPGKTFLSVDNYLFRRAAKSLLRSSNDSIITVGSLKVGMNESIRYFAETLSYFNIPLVNRNLLILYANEKEKPDQRFTTGLQQLLETPTYKEKFSNRVFLLNTSDLVGKEDRYLLDDHFRASGHEKIAAAIKKLMEQHPIQPPQP